MIHQADRDLSKQISTVDFEVSPPRSHYCRLEFLGLGSHYYSVEVTDRWQELVTKAVPHFQLVGVRWAESLPAFSGNRQQKRDFVRLSWPHMEWLGM